MCDDGCKFCLELPDPLDETVFDNTCLRCIPGFLNLNGVCVDTNCDFGQTFDQGACQDCPDLCAQCSNQGQGLQCDACMDGYNKNADTGDCEFGGSCTAPLIVAGSVATGQYCDYCPWTCSDCTWSTTTNDFSCTACTDATYTVNTLNNYCELKCDAGKYFNIWVGDC